jgi:hypothetical protein
MVACRSLKFLDLRDYIKGASYCSRKIFERLVEGGFLENNRQLVASYFWHDDIPQLLQETCSMKKLQKLNLLNCDLELAQLSGVFWSCSELTELHLTCNELWVSEMLKMDEHLIKDLRRGFQTLRHFEIECQNSDNSLPVIQQILT